MYPDEVRLVYHHHPFPLSDSPLSWVLAESLEFAGTKDKFWEMHDGITLDMPHDVLELMVIAEGIDLDTDELNEALDSGKYFDIVREAKEEAESRGVDNIALFINDTEYMKYPGTLDDLINAIDAELQRLETNGGKQSSED